MKKDNKISSYIKKIVIIALLLGAVVCTFYSCEIQNKACETAEALPQITNRE